MTLFPGPRRRHARERRGRWLLLVVLLTLWLTSVVAVGLVLREDVVLVALAVLAATAGVTSTLLAQLLADQ